jgi:hypothetical protein
MKRALLRSYIKYALAESQEQLDFRKKIMSNLNALGEQGIGVVVAKGGKSGYSEISITLYRTNVFVGNVLAALDTEAKRGGDIAEIQEAAKRSIVGMIGLDPPESGNPCNNAWQVSYVAGEGFSPILHDIAMQVSPTKTIMPDRNAVANKLVKFYKNMVSSRSDVSNKKLDSVELPPEERETPDTSDDCDTWKHEDPSREVLDYSFAGATSDFAALKKNHDEAMKMLGRYFVEYLGWEPEYSEELLSQVAGLFFTGIYENVPEAERGLKFK